MQPMALALWRLDASCASDCCRTQRGLVAVERRAARWGLWLRGKPGYKPGFWPQPPLGHLVYWGNLYLDWPFVLTLYEHY